jgi:hypothetical protein
VTATKHVVPFVVGVAVMLGGCGTYVPEIQENPWASDPDRLVVAIIGSIHCELKDAVTYLINADRWRYWDHGLPTVADWLNNWGTQVTLTLTIDEQSSVNPSGSYISIIHPITTIFTLLGGASVSSEATRIETLSYYYTINELYGSGKGCSHNTRNNFADHPTGSLLIQSDLKLEEWLSAVVQSRAVENISIATPSSTPASNQTAKNALSHEVKFIIISSGNITPMWKLVHATINQTGSLFMASRTRTHDLLMTFGPNVKAPDGTNSLGIGTPATNSNLAQQIGIANSVHMISSSP